MRQIYRPEFAFNFFVRTTGSPDQAIAALPREAQAIDPALPAFGRHAASGVHLRLPLSRADCR